MAQRIERRMNTIHHGQTKECPTPNANGSCPGHPEKSEIPKSTTVSELLAKGYQICAKCGCMWLANETLPCPACEPAATLGRKGGKSTSPAKQAAVRANVAKAREVRALKPICGRCEKVHSNRQLNICDDGIASGDQRAYVKR